MKSHKTWGGRFQGETDDRVERFTESISFDQRLYREDVIASQVARAKVAEPVHVAAVANRIPPVFAAPGLAVASSARVHPNIVHGQAIAGVAEHVAGEVLVRLSTDIAQQRSAA